MLRDCDNFREREMILAVEMSYLTKQVKYPEVRPQIENTVKACVDYMLTLQYPSGNFPSSVGSIVHDRLVQWCHGAPGWVYMFVTAYKVSITRVMLVGTKDLF